MKTAHPQPPAIDVDTIPPDTIDAMSRTLICTIGRLLQNPEIRADYERWKRERESRLKS